MIILPLSKSVKSSKLLTKVVFPAPLGPKSPKKDPFSREREKFDNASNPPNVLVRFVAFIMVEAVLFSMRNSTIKDFFLASKKPKTFLILLLNIINRPLFPKRKEMKGGFYFGKTQGKVPFFIFWSG